MQEDKLVTIENIIKKRKMFSKKADIKLIKKAYDYAMSNHGEQCRLSR